MRRPNLAIIAFAMGTLSAAFSPALAQSEILEVDSLPQGKSLSPASPTTAAPPEPTSNTDGAEAAQKKDSAMLPAAAAASPPASLEDRRNAATADSGFTIEVDRSLGKNADKSLTLALLGALILPGTGEIYLQEKSQAKSFLLVDLGFWASLLVSWWSMDSYLQSARNVASDYAGIDASNKSVAFLNTMSEYRSYLEKEHRNDSYELSQILSGKRDGRYEIPSAPENYWDFGSSNTPENTRHWKTFQSSLRYYRASKIALTFAIGGLALNRVAAMAHTLRLYRRTAQGLSWQAIPEIGPNSAGMRWVCAF